MKNLTSEQLQGINGGFTFQDWLDGKLGSGLIVENRSYTMKMKMMNGQAKTVRINGKEFVIYV